MGTPVSKFDRYVVKSNIIFPHISHGYSFAMDFPALNTKAEKIERGLVLAYLYSGCCAKNVTIVSAMCHVMAAGKKGQTLECLNSPVPSDFPPAADLLAANGTLRLGDANGTGIMGTAPTLTAPAQFDVGNKDDAALFRIEGEDYEHISRLFNGLPDGFVNRQQAEHLDPDFEFFAAGGVDYTSGTVPATEHNFWKNWLYFWNYIVKNAVMIKRLDIGDAVIEPTTNLWEQFDIDRVVYERIGEKKVGDPFGLSPGRRAG